MERKSKRKRNKKPQFSWTVMVYMAADAGPSFYKAALKDIEEMAAATFDDKDVKVVVHADAPAPWLAKCWEVKRGGPKQMEAPCDHKSLLGFVENCVNNPVYKAKHYLLVLWGHGEGIDWKEKALTNRPTLPLSSGAGNKRFAKGSQSVMELAELGHALRELDLGCKPKDVVVGFDSCLMSMVEVYCEISERVGWAVAANDEIPNTGWPYQKILNVLGENPGIKPKDLARAIAKECAEYYSKESPESKVSFSACDLSQSINLKNSVARLTATLTKCLKSNPRIVLEAIRTARDFGEDLGEKAYVDLNAFCAKLGQFQAPKTHKTVPALLKNASEGVVDALRKLLIKDSYVFSDGYPQKFVRESRAVSICFPESSVLEGNNEINWKLYDLLKFSKSEWPGFVQNLLKRVLWAKLQVE